MSTTPLRRSERAASKVATAKVAALLSPARPQTNGSNTGKSPAPSKTESGSASSSLCLKWLIVAVVFIAFASVVYSVWGLLPSEDRNFKVYPPWSLADAKGLSRYLNKYTVDYYGKVVAVYVVTYVFMQTFTVPGSLFLSLLAGSLFDTGTALLLVCSCAALGATCANRLSHYVGKELMEKYQAERLAKWRAQVDTQRGNLFNYMLFVRITPLIPNFFVNIAAPHVDVPLFTFFWGTFFGIMPPSILFIRMGSNLERLTAEDNTTSLPAQEMALLFLLGLLALAPIIFKDGVKKLTGVTI